mgnify:CR=1 FL=1
MIPKNIKREHVIKAIEEIEKAGIREGRTSKKFLLEHNGKYYPPKYIISLANKYANGIELDSSEFSGGNETNSFLSALGFKIVKKQFMWEFTSKPLKEKRKQIHLKAKNDERCPKCKEAVGKLLGKIYGKVEQDFKFKVGTHPEEFKNTPYFEKLVEIYEALQNHRGFKEFVKAKTLPPCDFFVPNPGFIVEFDESQHFTPLREMTLDLYPELELGFDKRRWLTLCEQIKARDNNPPYRDEQRAWYDTLRDFLPAIKDLKPTVRLFAKDFVWCNLNPDNPADIERFEGILRGESKSWKIEVKEDPNPFLARIIIDGKWSGISKDAKRLLENVYEKFPKGKRVKFLITCGGFIQFDWPKSVSPQGIGDNKNPNRKALNMLVEEAKKCAKNVLSNELKEKLREVTDYITLGADSYLNKDNLTKPHIELVLLVDLKTGEISHWTGKSYPTSMQQEGLVRISEELLETHFVKLPEVGRVMLLGCHDLKMFDPRHYKRLNLSKWRKNTIKQMHKIAKSEEPILVLHHPHTTVKIRTWGNAWNYLRKILPSVNRFLGAGVYYEHDRNRKEYDNLDEVLEKTKCGNTIDFIVREY